MRVQTGQKGQGAPSAYYLFNSRGKKLDRRPRAVAGGAQARPGGAHARAASSRRRSPTKTKASKGNPAKTTTHIVPPGKTTPGFPTGYQVLTVPGTVTVDHLRLATAAVCPGLEHDEPARRGVTYYYLFKHGVYPVDSNSPYPQMTGKDLKLVGHAGRLRPEHAASRS